MNEISATREAFHPTTEDERRSVLQQLQEILASPPFCNSKRYPALLRFCVENTLDGRGDQLKERNLGIEVFGRRADYDTNADTVVRFTASEVRKRLQLYYHEQGREARIRISLPAGSYVPEFYLVPESAGLADDLHRAGHETDSVSASLLQASPVELLAPEPRPQVSESGQRSGYSSLPLGPARHSNLPLWSGVLLLALLALGAALWFGSSRQTAVDRFWAPMLKGPNSILLCSGGSVFAPDHLSGVATAGRDTEYPFVSMQSASAIGHLSGLLERKGAQYDILAAASTTLPAMREHPLILLGGYNNNWTLRLLAPLRYHFTLSGENSILDSQHPETRWSRDPRRAYSDADDFAIIARFREPDTESMVVVLAGLGRNGTEGATQFVTSPLYMKQLSDRIGPGFTSKNMEVVIKTSVIEGKTGAPSIQAVYVW